MATYNAGHGSGSGLPAGAVPSRGLPVGHSMTNGGVAVDVFDEDMTFDGSFLDSVHGLGPLPFTPSYDFEGFNTFEDPFSYSARPAYDVPPDNEPFNEESPAQELDNKLLGFSAPLLKARMIDGAGNLAEANMSAELLGMFFVAEDVFGGDNTGRPLELTCYRRNLWQCSGQITLPRHISHIVDEQGQQLPVFELAASISAMESIEGKPTEIISIPWKSSNGEDTKSPSAPPNVPLDLSTGQELDHHRISLPVSWKRLQFKHATANNGRRKGLQQHYVVQINLLAKLKNGQFTKIAEIQSGPVIVRGRSPRNFDSRKDVPLSSDKKTERRTTASAADAATPVPKTERGADLADNLQRHHPLGNKQPGDWASTPSHEQQSPRPSKKVALAISPNPSRPPVPSWSSEASASTRMSSVTPNPATPRSHSFQRSTAPSSLPINLSLSEDERSPNRSNSDPISPHFPKALAAGQNQQKGLEDDDEELYEYFPLSLDDWMPPVDTIYRPHVVHHTIVSPDLEAQHVRSKTKRYFSSD